MAVQERSSSSGVSLVDQSYATMRSNVSQIEDTSNLMEDHISASIAKSMEDLFKRFAHPLDPNSGNDMMTGGNSGVQP